ncbi:putative protein OS=Stutzerimonas stutzeri OX=316 GN=CXK95_12240 PE=4 SV=1 [Stutzerimonas stutzeri]
MNPNDDQPNEEPDVTMTNAGEKNPSEVPGFRRQAVSSDQG